MKKNFLSILLCLCMVMALLPTTAFATGTTVGIYLRTLKAGVPTETSTSSKDDYVAIPQDQLEAMGLVNYYSEDAWGNWIDYGTFSSTKELTSSASPYARNSVTVNAVVSEIQDAAVTKTTGIQKNISDLNVTWDTLSWSQNSNTPDSWHLNGELRVCTVTFDLNGGTVADGQTTEDYTRYCIKGTSTNSGLPADPTREGYTFGGWYTSDETKITAIPELISDVTYYAHWTDNTYTETYNYAYDAQRDPAFPASVGAAITASGFDEPLKSDESQYSSNQGPWTLTEVGYYAEASSLNNPAPTTYLEGVVTAVASEYGLTNDGKDALLIHKLTDADGNHVAYGVVIAVDKTNGYALFVGDLWNASGAGYLLSNTAITDSSVTFNAQQVAQSKYSISLSHTTVTFAEAQTGYTVPAAQTITVTNTGDDATGELTVALGGANAGSFTLGDVDGDFTNGIETQNSTDTFTVRPNTGLSAGTHTATVTVSGDKVMPVTATVSFTVSDVPTTYTVTWKSQDGTSTLETDTGVAQGEYPSFDGVEPTKTKDAQYTYTFAGWATTANAESGTAVGSLPAVTGNVTYYAAFSKTARSYRVTLNPGEGASCDALTSYTVGTGATLPTPTKAGYTFGGWYDNSGFNGDAVTEISATDTGDKTFYAKWIRNGGSSGVSTYAITVESAKNGDVTSSPNADCTRAQIVTFLYRWMVK